MVANNLQFHTDNEEGKKDLLALAKEEFEKLKKRYDSILSGSVNVDTGEKDENPYNVKATVILETKIKNFIGIKVEKSPFSALRESFTVAERQLRKTIEKINRPWEKHKK